MDNFSEAPKLAFLLFGGATVNQYSVENVRFHIVILSFRCYFFDTLWGSIAKVGMCLYGCFITDKTRCSNCFSSLHGSPQKLLGSLAPVFRLLITRIRFLTSCRGDFWFPNIDRQSFDNHSVRASFKNKVYQYNTQLTRVLQQQTCFNSWQRHFKNSTQTRKFIKRNDK